MALFTLSLSTITRRTLLSAVIIASALFVYVGYGAVVVIGPALKGGWLPVWTFVWFPNIFFAGTTVILAICSRESEDSVPRPKRVALQLTNAFRASRA